MPVRIEVLRAFRILGPDGSECLVPSGKRTHLLQYLVIKKNGASRDELAAALWPSAPTASARQSLRQAISSLRGILGVDVLAGRDWIRLDESTCIADSWEFQERFSMSDHRGCLDLVAGALEANLPMSAPSAFVRIWETWHETLMRHIQMSVLAEARRALEAGDPEAAELAIGQGSLAGLSDAALRRDVSGRDTTGASWASRRLGTAAVESLVFRARRGLQSAISLVIESETGWTERCVLSAMDQLTQHTRPVLIVLPEKAPFSHLVKTLIRLPGGAGVSRETQAAALALTEEESLKGGDGPTQAMIARAVADGLDAVSEERAVILMAGVRRLGHETATILSEAMVHAIGDGVTIILFGEDEDSFLNPPVRALKAACATCIQILQIDGTRLYQAAIQDPTDIEPPRATFWRTYGAWSGVTVALIALTYLLATGRESPSPTPDEIGADVVFCAQRGDIPHFFRWGQDWGVERLSDDPADCQGDLILTGNGDSLYLPIRSGEEVQWVSYPNRRTRSNLTGSRLPFQEATHRVVRGKSATYIVLSVRERSWALYNTSSQDTVIFSLPEGGYLADLSERYVLALFENDQGALKHQLLDRETQQVLFMTLGDIDETPGYLTSRDQIVFARGLQKEDEDGSLELVMVDPESGSETLLTNNDWNDYGLHISKTRGHICWQAEAFGHYEQDILAMDLETQIEVLAVRGSGRQERCRFSLDGSFLTYISGESGDEELMLRFLDGGFEHRVTAFSGTEYVVGTVPIR